MRDVDVMFFLGDTALILASRNDKLRVVKHLIEHEANIEAKDNDGMFLDSPSTVLFSLCVVLLALCLWMLMCGADVMFIKTTLL